MKDINSLLSLFVDEPDAWGDHFKVPFKIEGKVYATDRHAMLIIPAEYAPDVQPLENYESNNILSIIPDTGPLLNNIITRDMIVALKAVPTVRESQDCKCCKGEGDVEFSFYYEGKSYTYDNECPICEGEGSFPDENGKVIPDPSKCITIGKSKFAPKYIKKLYQLCQFFDLPGIGLVSQPTEMAASLFDNMGIQLLVMPVKDPESVYTIA